MRMVDGRVAAAVLTSVFTLAGCGFDDAQEAAPTPSTPTPPRQMVVVMRLDFDGAVGPLAEGQRVPDASGSGSDGTVRLAGASPEPLRLVAGPDAVGTAAQFPAPCPAETGAGCTKAVIEVLDAPALDPGEEDFRFGASVLLAPDMTSAGSNVVQKGFAAGGGSQWKLQVDGKDGKPSCVVVGTGEETVYEARAEIGVADSSWHEIICERAGKTLTIEVDGASAGTAVLREGLSISPTGPVRLAGKNVKPNNDQYFGALDDVFFEVPQL